MSNNNNKKSPFMFQGFQNSKMRIPGKKKKKKTKRVKLKSLFKKQMYSSHFSQGKYLLPNT